MKKLVLFLIISFLSLSAYSQCAMCKAAVESNANGGDSMAAGLNSGIIYLMFIPYLLVGGVAFLIYKNKKKQKDKQGA